MIWEWHATLDSGVNLTTGETWRGHRVKYRAAGSRRWSTFLLDTSDGSIPNDTAVIRAIEAHAQNVARV